MGCSDAQCQLDRVQRGGREIQAAQRRDSVLQQPWLCGIGCSRAKFFQGLGRAREIDGSELEPASRSSVGPHGDSGIGIVMGPLAEMTETSERSRVVYTMAEASRIPRRFCRYLETVDQVWTPTAWGAELMVRNGIDRKQIRVVPLGVDSGLFTGRQRARGRRFRFLHVAKWEERKGCADLLRSFSQAFTASDPVELVMHCHNPADTGFDLRQAITEVTERRRSRPPRILASAPLSTHALVELYRSADAFVLPTRAEGWGLPVLEAMACALPCLVTDHGGLRTFCSPANAYLIPIAEMVPVDDPVYFDPALDWGEWAQPDLDRLVGLLRHVVQHPGEARRKGARARAEALRWPWERAARVAAGHLEELRSEVGR